MSQVDDIRLGSADLVQIRDLCFHDNGIISSVSCIQAKTLLLTWFLQISSLIRLVEKLIVLSSEATISKSGFDPLDLEFHHRLFYMFYALLKQFFYSRKTIFKIPNHGFTKEKRHESSAWEMRFSFYHSSSASQARCLSF